MLSIFAQNVFSKIIFDQQVLPVLPHASGKQSLSPRLIFNNSLDNKKNGIKIFNFENEEGDKAMKLNNWYWFFRTEDFLSMENCSEF